MINKIFLPLFVIILLSSCSAQYHLSRALKKDPSIIDTTYVEHNIDIKLLDDSIMLHDLPHEATRKIDSVLGYTLEDSQRVVVEDVIRNEVETKIIEATPQDTVKKSKDGVDVYAWFHEGKLYIDIRTPKVNIKEPVTFWNKVGYWFDITKWFLLVAVIVTIVYKLFGTAINGWLKTVFPWL